MTNEQQLFLQILRDYLFGVPTDLKGGYDAAQIVSWADTHELGGIFFAQCGALIEDPALQKKLRIKFGSAVSHAENLNVDYSSLRHALESNRIPYVPIKGVLVSACYPNPELRTMGDVDLLVHTEDAVRIRAVLEPLGFQNIKWAPSEWHYRKRASLFELQSELMDDEAPDIGHINRYFNDFWPHAACVDGAFLQLSPSFHFLYLIAHIAKHLRWIGVGFRQFYDLAMLMQRGDQNYDWDWIRREAESIGFFRFTRCCLALNERWFGVPSPYGGDCISDELFEDLTQKIFLNGVFGFENEANQIHAVEKVFRASSSNLTIAKLRAALRLSFPSYRDLTVSEKYAFLRGRPWLLPYAWVRRMIRGRHSRNAAELNAVLHASRSRVEDRRTQLRELGLTEN